MHNKINSSNKLRISQLSCDNFIETHNCPPTNWHSRPLPFSYWWPPAPWHILVSLLFFLRRTRLHERLAQTGLYNVTKAKGAGFHYSVHAKRQESEFEQPHKGSWINIDFKGAFPVPSYQTTIIPPPTDTETKVNLWSTGRRTACRGFEERSKVK